MLEVGNKVKIIREKSGMYPQYVHKTAKIAAMHFVPGSLIPAGYYLTGIPNKCGYWLREELQLITESEDVLATRFYRVKQDTPMWREGAILKLDGNGGYRAISDLWDTLEDQSACLNAKRVESKDNGDWFERVYETSFLGKVAYHTRDKAREILNRDFNSEEDKKK